VERVTWPSRNLPTSYPVINLRKGALVNTRKI